MRTPTPFLVLMCLAAPVLAQERKPDLPMVVTQGEAIVKRAPDQAFVDLAVETRAQSPRLASEANAKTMATVQTKLQSLGLAADAIRTRGYQLNPEYDYVNGKQVPRGYAVTNSVEVRVDRLEQLPEVIDTAVAAGATNAGSIRFELRDRKAAEREALKNAVADARARADAAATGAGLAVGRVISIQEAGSGPVPPPMPMMAASRAEMKAAVPTPVVAGEIEIRATVTLTAELK
jgi:uncharacterized protein YggE